MPCRPFKPTVKIVFVRRSRHRTRRVSSRDPSSFGRPVARLPRTVSEDRARRCLGKQALAGLLLKEGEDGLASYHSSTSTTSASCFWTSRWLSSRGRIRCANFFPASDGASKLRDGVHAELVLVAEKGRTELQAYKQALAGRTRQDMLILATARYSGLTMLWKLIRSFDQGLTLQTAIATESKRVDTALRSAESMIARTALR